MLFNLYGRDAELAQLIAAFDAAAEGKPQLVWLAGEPGSGKTRLLQEFYSALRTRAEADQNIDDAYWPPASDALIDGDNIQPSLQPRKQAPPIPYLWWGLRCTAGSEHSPDSFQAYVDAVDQLERHLGGIESARQRKRAGMAFASGMAELIAGLATPLKVFYGAAKLLKKLNDDLKAIQTGETVASDLRNTTTRTEDIFLQLFAALNPDAKQDTPPIPLVLLIDDAHWMDARSVAFTRRLLQQAQNRDWQVVVVLSLRNTELAAQAVESDASRLPTVTLPELRSSVARTSGAAAVHEINLPAELDAAPARSLLSDAIAVAGVKPAASALTRLEERAGRQPYYMLNYAEHVCERGWLSPSGELVCSDDELNAVPQDISELLNERLHRLPLQQLEVLQWGSVQGREFMSDLVSQVAAKLGRNTAQAMVELGSARDDHRLIASLAANEGLDLALYGFAHRLLHELVLSSASPEVRTIALLCLHEVLAEHFDAGKLDQLPFTQRRKALETLAGFPVSNNNLEGRKRLALIAGQLCLEYSLLQDYRAAEPWALRIWEFVQAQLQAGITLSDAQLKVIDEAFNVLKIRGNWEVCLVMQEALLADARKRGDERLAAEALRNVGRMKEKGGELDLARELYTEGLELARRNGAADTAAKITGQLGGLKHYQGEYAEALELYGQSLAELRQLQDTPNVLRTLNNMALVLESQGEYAKALAIYDEILADRVAAEDELEAAQIRSNIGNLYFEQGDYNRAFDLYSAALEVLKELGDEINIAAGLGNVGAVHEKRGDCELALRLYDESLSICRRIGSDHGAALTLTDMGSANRTLGRTARARECWVEAAALYRGCGLETEALKVEERIAELG